MREDYYARLGDWPKNRSRFDQRFTQQFSGPKQLLVSANEAAWWLRQALDDVDALVARWDALKPEIQQAMSSDWQDMFR